MLKLHPRLAPIKAAVFPLVKKDGMPEKALEIYRELKKRFNVFYDEKGAIGRRYRRQDEAGTPFCITVDGDTLERGHGNGARARQLRADARRRRRARSVAERAASGSDAMASGRATLVVIDRDGVINEDSGEFIKSVAEWRPIPGSLEAIAALHVAPVIGRRRHESVGYWARIVTTKRACCRFTST